MAAICKKESCKNCEHYREGECFAEADGNVCCICGEVFEGYGNNPWPVREEGRCCDDCNAQYVIMARLANL